MMIASGKPSRWFNNRYFRKSGPEELRLENTTYTRVSVFMNVFNCHVNRVPASGKVEEILLQTWKVFKCFSRQS